jgi:hypothetical protein
MIMDPLTYEAITKNPELIHALSLQARRERARTVHRLIIEPIRQFFTRDLFTRHATRSNLRHPRKTGGAPA